MYLTPVMQTSEILRLSIVVRLCCIYVAELFRIVNRVGDTEREKETDRQNKRDG